MRQPETRVEVYAIKVTLLGTSPPVWRRILVPREITLRNLHRTLQTVMGWTNSHLHQFVCQRPRLSDPGSRVGSKIADENRTNLGELIGTVGARLLYEYDFGDGWQHELLLEEVLLGDETFSRHAWRVNDVVRPKTVEGRKDLQNFSKHSRTPITRVTMRPVSGLAILSLNPSLQMKLIDDYAAGSTDAHKARSMSAIACLKELCRTRAVSIVFRFGDAWTRGSLHDESVTQAVNAPHSTWQPGPQLLRRDIYRLELHIFIKVIHSHHRLTRPEICALHIKRSR